MRRGTIVAGISAGVLGIGGAATATAADISVSFPSGTAKQGSYAPQALSAAATFNGTIDLTNPLLSSQFAADAVKIPVFTIPSVTVNTLPTAYNGPLQVETIPSAFTGSVNALSGSYDLSGALRFRFTTTTGDKHTCESGPESSITLAGAPINFATGAYGVSGAASTSVNPLATPADAVFCGALMLNQNFTAVVSSLSYNLAGTLTVPGLVPLPAGATPPVATPITPTTPTTPSTPATPAKAGRLSVSVSRPKTVSRGKSTVTKITVRNTGAGTARGVKVRLSAAKNVSPRSKSKSYTTIGAGKRRTFSIRLKTKKAASKSSKLTVRATGTGGLSASRSATLRLR